MSMQAVEKGSSAAFLAAPTILTYLYVRSGYGFASALHLNLSQRPAGLKFMRIISGNSKGRKILTPKGFGVTRPALEKVREAIFSSLGDVSDKIVLDVFAGSGSLGLEALSRGADRAYFIEAHPQAVSCLIANLKNLGFENQAHVFKRRLPQGLSQIEISQKPDIIFCDPPYDKNLLNPTLHALVEDKFIDPHTIVIVEHTKREMPEIAELVVFKERQYGQTLITYLQLKGL